MHEIYRELSYWLDPFFLLYFASINAVYILLLAIGSWVVYFRKQKLKFENLVSVLRSNTLPKITFLIAAYNERNNIFSVVENALHLSYRYKEILVVNDGSTDETLQILKDKYNLVEVKDIYVEKIPTKRVRAVYQSVTYPELWVIDKENGEKYDALNAGLNLCETFYVITLDADTYIDDQDFNDVIPDLIVSPGTIAVGASVRVRNGCVLRYNRMDASKFPPDYVTAMQSLEYLRTFLMREGWKHTGGQHVISGAFSVFVKDYVFNAGGFAPTVANDLEVIIRLNRMMLYTKTPYYIDYMPDPVAWTEVPPTIRQLGKQRVLWQRGLLESLWFHKTMFFNPRYGSYGVFVYPFLVWGEALEPIVECLGIIYIVLGFILGIVNPMFVTLFLALTWGFIFIYTLFCIMIEDLTFRKYLSFRSIMMMIFYSAIEIFGYRQLTVWWRLKGLLDFYRRFDEISKDSKKLNESIKRRIEEKIFP